ncbi:MAG TPA: DUF5722 domain-containing protein, partial [Prolixibacteraceae bacterium]|nr:DUF5722 domain-containing protein [Prolixibacteraceae bacterium]
MSQLKNVFQCRSMLVLSIFMVLTIESNAQPGKTVLELDINNINQINAERQSGGVWQLETSGKDPWIYTMPLKQAIGSEAKILSFDYFCPKGLDHLQVYFGPSISQENSKMVRRIGLSEGWVGYTIDLGKEMKNWGKTGDFLRLDFGSRPDVNIQIRNLVLRPMSAREIELAANREAKVKREAEMEARLKAYLAQDYSSVISEVEVEESKISVEGKTVEAGPVYLCEIAPYQDVTEQGTYDTAILLKSKKFEQKLERFADRNGIRYDRALSKWVLAVKDPTGFQLISHARYPDKIKAKYSYPKEVAKGRKGIGGFSVNRGHLDDLDELGATSATVNIWFTKFMFTKPAPDRLEHVYNGKSWYFREKEVAMFDSTFRTTA